MDDRSFLSSFPTSRSFSVFGGTYVTIGNDWDFTCDNGIADYLKTVRLTTVTKSHLEKKKQKTGMPPRWSHSEFLVEVVYD